MHCCLCNSEEVSLLPKPRYEGREFWACAHCKLIFVPKPFHLDTQSEKQRYDTHENYPDDPAYRRFFAPFVEALVPRLIPSSRGLDFGAGPGPALAAILREKGFSVSLYDKYFHPDPDSLQTTYDFITCTETAEHFQRPLEEFEKFQKLIRPGGWLGVLTSMLPSSKKFEEWYYPRDPTHVAFYEKETMQWIAARFKWESSFPVPNVALFRKAL